MAKADASNLPDFLKPFHERASLAEERLTKLEALLNTKTSDHSNTKVKQADGGATEEKAMLGPLIELREKMEKVKVQHAAEREETQRELLRLATENAKFQYRISHLVQALKEADEMLEKTPTPNV